MDCVSRMVGVGEGDEVDLAENKNMLFVEHISIDGKNFTFHRNIKLEDD